MVKAFCVSYTRYWFNKHHQSRGGFSHYVKREPSHLISGLRSDTSSVWREQPGTLSDFLTFKLSSENLASCFYIAVLGLDGMTNLCSPETTEHLMLSASPSRKNRIIKLIKKIDHSFVKELDFLIHSKHMHEFKNCMTAKAYHKFDLLITCPYLWY